MTTNNTSLKKATDFLSENLEKKIWIPGNRLPPIQALARMAGVQSSAMNSAVRKSAALVTIPRKGVFVRRNDGKPFVPVIEHHSHTKIPKWEQIRSAICKDILEDAFTSSEYLPSQRELKQRYTAGATTLQKVLDSLIDNGIISAEKRRFKIIRSQNRASNSCVVFISQGVGRGTIQIFNDRIKDCVQTLELEVRKKGLQLVTIGVGRWDNPESAEKKLAADLKTIQAPILGFIIWPSLEETAPPSWISAIRSEFGHKFPVAIIDEFGTMSLSQQDANNRSTIIFSIAGKLAGKKVGEILLTHGHRHAAYFAVNYHQAWSKSRYDGLQSAFENRGLPASDVALYQISNSFPAPDKTNATFGLQNKLENFLTNLAEKAPVAMLYFNSTSDFSGIIAPENNYAFLRPIFEKALKNKTITAWIIENNIAAFCAYYFLRLEIKLDSGLPVLVFFDYDRVLSSYSFSNYDFSFSNIGQKALTYILNPRHEFYWNKTRIECEGFFVERSDLSATPSTSASR